jgi:exopolyphosphatase/guanosine-5'-triphosphate,3'-diphosphate pyrophosphatase
MYSGASSRRPVAIIDIGSNSGRVVILALDNAGHLRVLAGSRAPLRLVHDVDETRSLSEESMARTMDAVRDFHAVAVGAGAGRIVAVATSAVRDAKNGQMFRDRVRRELGIRVDIIDGRTEARYGFVAAVRGLPVAAGLWFDLGGGSLQVSPFASRRPGRATSLPLGALRLSETFLTSDPPKPRELRRLRDHVWKHLKKARVRRLGAGETLVGTGGTLRNLAKIDRSQRVYPVSSLHGYALSIDRLHAIVTRMSATRHRDRDEIAGLSAERADSIVGGAVAIEGLMELAGARHVLVSSQGVREGIALSLLGMNVTSTKAVREASLASLAARFDGWRAEAAERRRATAAALLRALDPRATPAVAVALDHGARLLDIGTSLDFFERHEHVADMLLATELHGFTHEEIARVSGLVRLAGDRHADIKALSPLLDGSDRTQLVRSAVILALADEIERRCPPGRAIAVSCSPGRDVIKVSVPLLSAWRSRDLGQRFERAFGKSLVVMAG